MKIIELTAENVKRLRAVDITPDQHFQVIGGRNAQGKTSVLDALWLALGGGAASKSTARPIRDGEDTASVRLDLGDLVVTRTWTGDRTALTVTSADGARYGGPQGVLDSLVGRLSFDPLEFTRLSAREQVSALLDLVDLDVDLDQIAHDRQAAYDQRTEIGRQVKALGEIPAETPDMPDAEVSASEIIGQIRAAQESNRRIQDAEDEAARARALIASLESDLAAARDRLGAAAKIAAGATLVDTADLETRLARVEETNRAVRLNAEIRERQALKERLLEQYERQTQVIAGLDATKGAALAKATFPVDGLGFDDSGVTYRDVPFSQASSAEQIRVSLAMAMSLNPRLRVIRILDGSLLDADNLALIEEMARERDYQVWIERVGDADEGAVIIEDGAVA